MQSPISASLYRQSEICARLGADSPRSTLIDWCGQTVGALAPLVAKIRQSVLSADRLHADDTPNRVLDRSKKGKGVRQGRIWTYVRDHRPWAGQAPPGAVHRFAPRTGRKSTSSTI